MSLVLDSNIGTIFTKSGIEITKVIRKSDGAVLWEVFPVGTAYDFAYTGGIQTLTAPATGTYKLEVWGAQGGGVRSYDYGGNGGYSQGMVQLTAGQKIYIVVGGKGATAQSAYISTPGGYNGGGKGHSEKQSSGRWPLGGGGGGATHIATASGLLSELSSNKESVLIVAGGGGGAAGRDGWNGDGSGAGMQVRGGTGGGTTGGAGVGDSGRKGLGGTQTAGGAANLGVATTAGTFGQGGSGDNTYTQFSGGGGGYYGGSAGYYTASAGGGSGYVGGVTDGTTENGKQTGNGKAKITYLAKNDAGIVEYIVDDKTYTEKVPFGADCLNPTSFTVPTKTGMQFIGWAYTDDGEILNSVYAYAGKITLHAVWAKYIFKNGATSNYTGGWTFGGDIGNKGNALSVGQTIYCNVCQGGDTGGDNEVTGTVTSSTIDFTNITTLRIKGSTSTHKGPGSGDSIFRIKIGGTTYVEYGMETIPETIDIDVSNLTSGAIQFYMYGEDQSSYEAAYFGVKLNISEILLIN